MLHNIPCSSSCTPGAQAHMYHINHHIWSAGHVYYRYHLKNCFATGATLNKNTNKLFAFAASFFFIPFNIPPTSPSILLVELGQAPQRRCNVLILSCGEPRAWWNTACPLRSNTPYSLSRRRSCFRSLACVQKTVCSSVSTDYSQIVFSISASSSHNHSPYHHQSSVRHSLWFININTHTTNPKQLLSLYSFSVFSLELIIPVWIPLTKQT